ncbi:MAG TPA: hypothetical protein VGQ39_22690 [Pyrinomonadaceae bacterium]|nr:hypothetical protein [Pyrinomonadaceae bacterium]
MTTPTVAHARRLLVALVFAFLIVPVALAQSRASSPPEALLDKMTGHWVMTGTISRKPVTHDVDIDWVLNRRYIRIHEVSRGKDGGSGYEAWIYIVWDAKNGEYAVMWLDNTAATNFSPEGIGHAKPDGDRIPFIFNEADGTGIHTTFAYNRAKDTWSWSIDNVDKSRKSSSFARLTLTRK